MASDQDRDREGAAEATDGKRSVPPSSTAEVMGHPVNPGL